MNQPAFQSDAEELVHLRRQRDELQETGTRLLLRAREAEYKLKKLRSELDTLLTYYSDWKVVSFTFGPVDPSTRPTADFDKGLEVSLDEHSLQSVSRDEWLAKREKLDDKDLCPCDNWSPFKSLDGCMCDGACSCHWMRVKT